jgi:periplasmic protein TonB
MKRINLKIQAVMAVVALLVFIVACTNNNQSTKSSAYDSSNVATSNDTSMNHMQQPADTAATNVSTEKSMSKESSKSTASKTTVAKRKGKATLGTMAEMKKTAEAKATFKPDANGIYDATEVRPMYPGGHAALSDYIANHIDYPQMAIDDNKGGTVNVQFVVDENGKVQNAKVVGSKLGDGLDEEAERVIASMPKWDAGMVKGKPVKTRMTVPITYQIEEQ